MIAPRLQALKALLAISKGASMRTVLPAAQVSLNGTDRRLCQTIVYGVLRWHHRLLWITDQLLHKKLKSRDSDISFIIQMGLYQIYQMRIPDYAAVSTSVELARCQKKAWATARVNAVLRAAKRQQSALFAQMQTQEVAYFSCPQWLLNSLKADWPAQWQQIVQASNAHPPMSLRVNQRQLSREHYREMLQKKDIAVVESPCVPTALTLQTGHDVADLPGFDDGYCSVQDIGAQLAVPLLNPQNHEDILDACAAPGGKTVHIKEHAPDANLTALDISSARMLKLRENVQRTKTKARLIVADLCQSDSWFDGTYYHRILLDAPCSATGVWRRHPDIKLLRRADDIETLTRLQAACLSAVWPLLRPGGVLLYVTCSVLKAENDIQVKRFLSQHPDASQKILDVPDAVDTGYGYQLLPGNDLNTDGFFYAAFCKADSPN